MVVIAILTVGLAMGIDPRRLGLMAIVVYLPLVAVVGLVPVFMLAARRTDARPALFCEGIGSELRSGASVAEAVAASALAVGASEVAAAARSGDLAATASTAGVAFPGLAAELAVTIVRAGSTGAAAADLFDEIAALALAEEEIRREVRVAAAPARAATALFVILPGAFLVSKWASGDLASLVASNSQRLMVSIGLAVFLFGLAISGVLVWRVR